MASLKIRSLLLSGLVVLAPWTSGLAAPAETSGLPPGPVQTSSSTNAAPATSAPPQASARSAPGASSPNGANGTTRSGKAVTKAPNTPAPGAAAPAPAPVTAAAVKPAAAPVLDNYMKELADTLKLTAEEKQDIETYYLADGVLLDNILNNASISPLQQATQVSDLRDARNEKIEALLQDVDRQHEFLQIESRYRVALTELAADGGLVPAQSIPAAPAPSATPPGQTDPTPRTNRGDAG
jgi:hypothetical protein